jgi:predicted Holliday junction resolvase-like endonuclease
MTAVMVHEQLSPYLPAFHHNTQEAWFLGVLCLVVLGGLAEGGCCGSCSRK